VSSRREAKLAAIEHGPFLEDVGEGMRHARCEGRRRGTERTNAMRLSSLFAVSLVAIAPVVACSAPFDRAPSEGTAAQRMSESSIIDTLAAAGGVGARERLSPYADLIEPHDAPLPLPANPVATLADAITTLSADIGVPRDPSSLVNLATLEATTAGRLANVVRALDDCTRSTQRAIGNDRLADLLRDAKKVDGSRFADLPRCAKTLAQASRDLEHELERLGSAVPFVPKAPLDLWPVLYVDFAGADNTYVNDYLLIADFRGNDVYANNAGSNVIDVNVSPAAGRARGCQTAISGVQARDCVVAAAVVIDTSGNDTYGKKESPDVDAVCTHDDVIRRMLTNGVGLAGVGMLIDSRGNDSYTGKTVSNGAGHLFGIGILWDRSGNDSYSSVRNSQGFALVGGLGLLRDESGDDTYDYYMPSAIDPSAPDETAGAGGVSDDEPDGPFCDRSPRFTQGAADFTGIGLLIDDAGNDRYHGGYSQTFGSPAPIDGRAGSQGFANNGGFGALYDRGGVDSYAIDNDQGSPSRTNGGEIAPDPTCTSSTCHGLFIDEE
jgi:hypothetical protein